jgi:hypothetical protein
MPYNADNTGVTALTGVTYTASTIPTTTQVSNFRTECAADINSILKSRGYSVPATGANDIVLLAGYENLGAAVKAEQAAYRGNVQQPRVTEWNKKYEDFLNRLRLGQADLIDQTAEGDLEPYWTSAPTLRRDDYFVPEENR